jgi:ribosomal protein S11
MATVKRNLESKKAREKYAGANNDSVAVSRRNCSAGSLATTGPSLESGSNAMKFAAMFTSRNARPRAKSRGCAYAAHNCLVPQQNRGAAERKLSRRKLTQITWATAQRKCVTVGQL